MLGTAARVGTAADAVAQVLAGSAGGGAGPRAQSQSGSAQPGSRWEGACVMPLVSSGVHERQAATLMPCQSRAGMQVQQHGGRCTCAPRSCCGGVKHASAATAAAGSAPRAGAAAEPAAVSRHLRAPAPAAAPAPAPAAAAAACSWCASGRLLGCGSPVAACSPAAAAAAAAPAAFSWRLQAHVGSQEPAASGARCGKPVQ
jgi:hypothetical protein